MTTILPISEMRDTAKILNLCEKEPVFITKNGYGCMVVLDISTFNEMKEKLLDIELQENYRRSLKEGGNREAKEFLESLRD